MLNVVIYGLDMERLKAAALKLRSNGCKANTRDASKFRSDEVEPSFNVVLLLDPSEMVKSAYEAYNSRVSDDKKLEIREEYGFKAVPESETAKLENRPHWPDMTVRELLEYATENFGVKLIGTTKKEIIDRVDALWREKNGQKASEDTAASD